MTPASDISGEVERIAAGLSEMEQDLFLGRCNAWGSWMWSVGNGLVHKGLGTKRLGNISFDTPLAVAVRAHLLGEKAALRSREDRDNDQ